jgi:predicted nucleotidyltransferase component of viral defense system
METMLKQMIDEHHTENIQDKRNAIKEVVQEIVLCGLSRVGFFRDAAFYGGTALRIFYGLDRFSEDLDFSLHKANKDFNFDKYLQGLKNELNAYGLNLEISIKEKTYDSDIKSAFIKASTKELILKFFADESLALGLGSGELTRVKFEVDTTPPSFAKIENKFKQLPIPYEVAIYDMPSLFAGKVHAVLCRTWKNRVKGRDLYDYAFYISKKASINLQHLNARLIDSGFMNKGEELTIEDLKSKLKEKFHTINFKAAREDVIYFIKDPTNIEIWSSNFFCSITDDLVSI